MHNQEIEVPNIGMTLSRAMMPQFSDPRPFLRHLKDKFNITHTVKNLDTKNLRSTQSEFDDLKVKDLMFSKKRKDPILVSTDGHILDGHHRWIADHNTTGKSKAYVIDHPVLELRAKAQQFNSLNEEITHKEFGPMLDSFMSFASSKLGLKSLPTVRYKDDSEQFKSFGGYNPADNSIVISTKNRNPMDVFRTIAHELVHHKQNEDGRIKDVAKEGATGSEIEDEANAVAGRIMRWYAKTNPGAFNLTHIVENRAVFVVGVPCSGKDSIVRELKEANFQELNIDSLHKTDIISENLVISTVAHDYDSIVKAKELLEYNNFQTEMIFVDVSNDISKLRNEQRKSKGQRVINESVRFQKYEQSKQNLEKFKTLFEDVEVVVNEDLRKWFREKWVRYDTKGNIKGPCAREPGEGKPKCRPLASARAMSKEERAKSARRKRRKDPVADRSGKGGKPINVKTESVQDAIDRINRDRMSEEILMEKNQPTNPSLWARAKSLAKQKFDVYPSAYANGWAAKWYKSKGGGWKSVNESFNDFVNESTPNDREWGTDSLAELYAKETPGQEREVKRIHFRRKKLNQEEIKIDSPLTALGIPPDGLGPEYAISKVPSITGSGFYGVYGLTNESVIEWSQNPKTIERFVKKYGHLAEEKLIEAAQNLDKVSHTAIKMPKSIQNIREEWGSRYGGADMGTVPKTPPVSVNKDKVYEDSPAWTRKEGQDPEGGLNRKGIASYRRANPGSKLSMAVTTKPSKLKKGSKAAKRRKSFCARMGGMKKRLTSAKTARDPNSRINKALRKWNCEE